MTKEQIEKITKMWNKCTVAEIARATDLTREEVSKAGHLIGKALRAHDPEIVWLDHRLAKRGRQTNAIPALNIEALVALARGAADG